MYKYYVVNASMTHAYHHASDITLSFNYNYTFTLLELKRNAERAEKRAKN